MEAIASSSMTIYHHLTPNQKSFAKNSWDSMILHILPMANCHGVWQDWWKISFSPKVGGSWWMWHPLMNVGRWGRRNISGKGHTRLLSSSIIEVLCLGVSNLFFFPSLAKEVKEELFLHSSNDLVLATIAKVLPIEQLMEYENKK
jgi:hypothetical protein